MRSVAHTLAFIGLAAFPSIARAGMPAPLPIDTRQYSALGEEPLARLQSISFFLLVFLVSAVAFRLLWNYLCRDFPQLPRLSWGRALVCVFLWGMLFVVVLTMISGARELLTPGAWKRDGATYQLADKRPEPVETESGLPARRQHLEKLRTALWQFAATHGGRFPTSAETATISSELWQLPGVSGLRYLYVADRTAGFTPEVLVYEPEVDSERRLVLRANGDIVEMRSEEIRSLNLPGKMP